MDRLVSDGTVGVVIGRFQVDELHAGHLELLNLVEEKHPNMLVLLGCKPAPPDSQYPLEYGIREQMIRSVCSAKVLAIFDTPSDEEWSRNVDALIRGIFPNRKAVLYGGRDSFMKHYYGKFATREVDFGKDDTGIDVRKRIAAHPEGTPAFRRGVIYTLMNLSPRVFPTVDVAVTRPEINEQARGLKHPREVLLIRKREESLWRFPGGFVDSDDESVEKAAARELKEETGLMAISLAYVGSLKVDDWRSRGLKDVGHLTLFFTGDGAANCDAVASDDAAEARWFPLGDGNTYLDTMAVHRPLMRMLIDYDRRRRAAD